MVAGDREFITQEHFWETRANPQFDYEEDDPWLGEAVERVRELNGEVLPYLEELRTYPFFKYFAVDLLASCGYMPTSEQQCELDACEIDPEDDVDERMVERDQNEYEFELDGWARWDMPSDFTEYYDIHANSEGNTGYDGSRVWRFIHQKICFQLYLDEPANRWKRDFNRAFSGLHASISSHILADIGKTDEAEALAQWRRRIRDEPGAETNLYFTYMLLLSAVDEIRERLDTCTFLGDERVQPVVRKLSDSAILHDETIARAAENLRAHARGSAALVWKARLRTRDMLRIMNCVQCNLCRLHGKVAALGLSTALRVLLGDEGEGEDPYALHRVEIGALVATAGKLGAAVAINEKYRAMSAAEEAAANGGAAAGSAAEEGEEEGFSFLAPPAGYECTDDEECVLDYLGDADPAASASTD